MRPSLLDQETIDRYLAAGHWSPVTMLDSYAAFARDLPDVVACRDSREEFTWRQLDETTDRIAANLVARGISRDARALVQMPSSSREMVLRTAFKKAGIIGSFAPMQWRRRELEYVFRQIEPDAVFVAQESMNDDRKAWLDRAAARRAEPLLRVALSREAPEDRLDHAVTRRAGPVSRVGLPREMPDGWVSWPDLDQAPRDAGALEQLSARRFRFDEVSVITVSSGTSGVAKLCEWPEAAQVCIGRGIAGRLAVGEGDNVGIFAPMSGAAGVLAWVMSGAEPCAFTFPDNYHPRDLLELVEKARVTVATTVPVILARLSRQDVEPFDLSSLRALRCGTAAMDVDAARRFESRTGCRVVVASGSMECPGFGHADFNEPRDLRLDGTVGLPLPGCRLRIDDDNGNALAAREIGEVKVSAAFASSGYWADPEANRAVWSDGWYATGDMGFLDEEGRLTLLGRRKEVINRSGHKILPLEVEQELAKHPDVFDCAVVAAPDPEYGEVPWAFVQTRDGIALDTEALVDVLRAAGMATYKIPARFIELSELPRVAGSKVDKKRLLEMAPGAPAPSSGTLATSSRTPSPSPRT